MRLANGIVLDKDTTFGELKFSALRREVKKWWNVVRKWSRWRTIRLAKITRQEQYHDEQTSKQSNIQTSYKESQQAKQERPAVKSDFSSPKVERQGNTVQEKTVQKPATSTTTADRTSQRPITKERPSTVQRVPLQNTRSRPPIKTATIKKVGKKPWSWKL